MSYVFQNFSVAQVLTAAQMNQVEVSIRDHIHGASSVVKVPHAGLEGPYTAWHLFPDAVTSGSGGGGIGVLRSTNNYLIVPAALTLKVVRLEAFIESPSTVGTYLALFRIYNGTDAIYTTVACLALIQSTNASVVVSATAASPVYSLGASKKWTFSIVANQAPAAIAADKAGMILSYAYE